MIKLGLESKEVSYLGFKFRLEDPSDTGEDTLDEVGQETVIFEAQVTQSPRRTNS
ncbi:MAG TPA: hypothetical protein VES68_04145 [Candidatus Sulfotelmatobacter sp.]|nr:hypothetical protein [Candidatus Sulfotelmatobacter sp.]